MSNQSTNYPNCTEKCRSTQHGDIITAAISKRSISDSDLCSYLNYICTCCESVRDLAGRTALHVAASCGRLDLVKWLVQYRHANINSKDEESGYTALHRSIFYGKIDLAVELIKLGANTQLQDSEGLTYLDHAMKDGFKPDIASYGGELYVWGANSNNSLGPQKSRSTPEMMDVFHREHPSETVQQVCVDQFHSVIVTRSGKAFSCGHGQGGRLGLGSEQTIVTPKLITFPESKQSEAVSCLCASISRDHSVFLGSNGNVYTCGQNTNRVLGISPPPQDLLVPKPLRHLSLELKGVCASRYHSVAWGPTGLYTWGINGGQLGHTLSSAGEKYILTPKQVTSLNLNATSIKCVASSDGATAIYTEKGDIYLLHEYQCRKIASRQLNIVKISVIGGKLNLFEDKEFSNKHIDELKVAALTNTGNLLLWQESDPQLCRCIFSLSRALIIKHVVVNTGEVLFATEDGEVFSGTIRPRKKKGNIAEKDKSEKNAFHKFLEREDCIYIKLTKCQKIHRALSVESDPKGRDFCVIQAYPYRFFLFPNECESEIKEDFTRFFEEIEEYDIHDVSFKIEHEIFPVHGFILSSKSPHLAKLIEDGNDVITLENVNPDIFRQLLMYVYTGCCDLIKVGELENAKLRKLCIKPNKNVEEEDVNDLEIDLNISAYEYYANNKKQTIKDENSEAFKDPVKLLRELSKRLAVMDLYNVLTNFDMHKFTIRNKMRKEYQSKPVKFCRDSFPHLYDVTISCKDGKEIKGHKCILAARLEYFRFMFSMRWQGSQTSEISLPFSKPVVESLLEFLYTDSLASLDNSKDIDHLLKVLILADQLVVTRLKEQCEFLLTNMLTLKNAIYLLSFSHDLNNAKKLSECCMKFVISNVTAFLDGCSLNDLEEGVLKELSECYYKEKERLQCRVLTPYSTAVGDEEIARVAQMFPVDFEAEVERERVKSAQKRRSRPHKSNSEKHISLSLEATPNPDSIIQFPDIPDPPKLNPEPTIPSRLKSITSAASKIKDEPLDGDFTRLSSSLNLSGSFNDEFDFPELGSPPNAAVHNKAPQKDAGKHKMAKMSQKQRKRLSSESGNASSPVPESPKNPWKALPEMGSPGKWDGVVGVSDMGSIILDEKKQKENLVKITSKSLRHTQIEDKAIEDLHKFYNTENMPDEIIYIERVGIGAIASPVWVPRTK